MRKIYTIPTLILLIGVLIISCSVEDQNVLQDTEEYKEAVANFYMSIAASQTDQARFAFNKMNVVAEKFPQEAAAWANLGVFAMRQGNFDLSADRFEKAREAAPGHPDILFLSSVMESRRGNLTESIQLLREGAASAPEDPRLLYALAGELERQGGADHRGEVRDLLQQLHRLIPQNRVVLLELIRLDIRDGSLESAANRLGEIQQQSGQWTAENRSQLEKVIDELETGDPSDLALELSLLRTGLESEPLFQQQLRQIQPPPTDLGYLITRFINLPQPELEAAEPDLDMKFTNEELDLPQADAVWVKGVTLLEESSPFPVSISESGLVIDPKVTLAFPGNTNSPLPPSSVAEIDYNYNFRNDLAVVGNEGFRLYRQNADQTFTDVTGEIGLPPNIISGNYSGVWPFDIEMDGDLDLLLARRNGFPIVLQNNGDQTFTERPVFESSQPIADFYWADLDSDGPPEAIILTQNGEIQVYRNLRGGSFDEPVTVTENSAAMTVADLDADGRFNLISTDSSGTVTMFKGGLQGMAQDQVIIEQMADTLRQDGGQPGVLFAADLDNNGALDLVISSESGTQIFLADEKRKFEMLDGDFPGGITSAFDMNGNGRLDLLGVSGDLKPFTLNNAGTKDYFSRSIRARASGTDGDQRINSFGLGGEMEVRSGVLYQKQLITSPIVHFGLGEYEEAQMLRIIWPNGSVQAEFAELGMGATIFNEQILKGSCPWLFAHNGNEIQFVTDAIWRSPLGLRINSQETAGVIQTYDRVRVTGDQLKETDGIYDLRITAELWETHFFDHVKLMAVDHPEETEIFVDERFVFPAPDLSTRLMSTPSPVTKVLDENGRDVTSKVSELDRNYFQPFIQKSAYQGLTERHSFVVELGDEVPEKPLWLTLSGWLRPTDSSINLALSQGSHQPPEGLKIDVQDPTGEWRTVHEDYGIPAGKLKTILLDLEGIFAESRNRKIRFSTTSEIYWDGIFWAEKAEPGQMKEYQLQPVKMDLKFRGYSKWSRADSVSPMLPEYSEIAGTTQRWRDLEGFYTRFGDVSELLKEIDDRYVIMNAGDEIELQFRAPEPAADGYKRSFVFVSDGWVKDGDYNTEASATVLPLPYHGHADYEYSLSGTLLGDPVFDRHREDWVNFHTRYVTTNVFGASIALDDE